MFTVMAAWLLSITFARFAFGHSFGFELGRSLTEGVLLIGAGAQETGWTGGDISFPGWRSAQAVSRASMRTYRPVAALFWKELQLHQVGLAGIAGLFLLHLGVVILRRAGAHAFSDVVRTGLEVFGGIWLVVPLLVGSRIYICPLPSRLGIDYAPRTRARAGASPGAEANTTRFLRWQWIGGVVTRRTTVGGSYRL